MGCKITKFYLNMQKYVNTLSNFANLPSLNLFFVLSSIKKTPTNMRIKILLLTLLLLVVGAFDSRAVKKFENETLGYVISYKWGLIHKDAGDATLTLRNNGNVYNIILTARSKPWADNFYKVRDTLKTSVRVADLKPISYSKITHEKGEYKLDEISFSHSDSGTTGVAKRHRKKDGKWNVTEKSFTATGPVFDMLSVFYYLRQLDFATLDKNKIYTATIFSGRQKEILKIRYIGTEKIKLKDKSERSAYHIRFNFTRDGGKKSSDDMDIWISTDGRHIPLYLTAKLPVGEVRGYYTGG